MKKSQARTCNVNEVLLFVDGGASNGRAALLDGLGNWLFSHIEKGLNPWLLSDAEFEERFIGLVAPLFKVLDRSPHLVRARIGLAGVGDHQTHRRTQRIVRKVLANFSSTIQMVLKTDVAILADALIDSEGVILLAGTGSVCVAVSKTKSVRVGGWGFLFDRGSGFEIGIKAIRIYLNACDGGERIAWLEDLLKADPPRLWARLGLSELCRRIASVAKVVLELSERGDPVARSIAVDAAQSLTELVESAWNRAGLKGSKPVYVAGGLTRNRGFFYLLRERLELALPTARVSAVNRSLLELMLRVEGVSKIKT